MGNKRAFHHLQTAPGRERSTLDEKAHTKTDWTKGIGRGKYSHVFLATCIPKSDKPVTVTGRIAVKEIDLTHGIKDDDANGKETPVASRKSDLTNLDVICRLCALNDANIVPYLDAYHIGDKFYILTQYIRLNLYDYQRIEGGNKAKRLHPDRAAYWAGQIGRALAFMHSIGIAHLNLKSRSIMLKDAGPDNKFKFTALISELGMSEMSVSGGKVILRTMRYGVMEYLSPEIILKKPYDPFKADVFSFGVIIFHMLTGTYPFKAHKKQGLKETSRRATAMPYKHQEWSTDPPVGITYQSGLLLLKLLCYSPIERPGICRVLTNFSWLKPRNAKPENAAAGIFSLLFG